MLFFRLCRYKQWIKNLFVLAPLFFSFRFMQVDGWQPALLAMLVFMCVSSATYIVNDLLDRKEDRQHPRKSQRPIASGAVSVAEAILVAIGLLLVAAWALLAALPFMCLVIVLAYVALQCLYNMWLKDQPVVDVIIIAVGFVLRILMGGYAIAVQVSPWIILTTFLLALFLGFGKRYHELLFHRKTRKSLNGYNKPLLDRYISISCGSTLVCYALYAVETAREIGRVEFLLTIAFVLFGLFRYLNAIYFRQDSGEPEEIVMRDLPFVVNALLWAVVTMLFLVV